MTHPLFWIGILIGVGFMLALFFIKIQPRCRGCMERERIIGRLHQQNDSGTATIVRIDSELKEARKENKELVNRMLLNAGVKDPKPSPEKLKNAEEIRKEQERQEKLVNEGGAVVGGVVD